MKKVINIVFSSILLAYMLGFGFINDLVRVAALFGLLGLCFGIKFSEVWLIQGYLELDKSIGTKKWPTQFKSWTALFTCVYFALAFVFLPLLRHWSFGSWMWDLGVMEQVIWRGAFGFGLTSTAIPNQFGTTLDFLTNGHLNFWLYPTALVYRFLPHTETLLFMQSLVLLLALIPLWKVAQILFPKWASPICLLVIYWFCDAVHRNNIWDIHENCYLPMVSLWAYYFFLKEDWWKVCGCTLAVALFKEDAWIVAGSMGFYFFASKKKWIPAFLCLIAGFSVYIGYSAFFNKVNSLDQRYRYLGASFKGAIPIIIHDPFIFLRQLMTPMSYHFMARLVMVGGGLWLFSGLALIPVLPTLFECALSTFEQMPSFDNHYVLALIGPLLFATAMGLKHLENHIKNQKSLKIIFTICMLVSVAQLYLAEPTVIKSIIKSERWLNRKCLNSLVEEVPPEAVLYSRDPLISHLTKRAYVLWDREKAMTDYKDLWAALPEKDILPSDFSTVDLKCGYRIAHRVAK